MLNGIRLQVQEDLLEKFIWQSIDLDPDANIFFDITQV